MDGDRALEGTVRAGESWSAAAVRIGSTAPGDAPVSAVITPGGGFLALTLGLP